jgi:FolB domain-containing protein
MNEPKTHNDKIYIRDLSVRCIIGVNDDERTEKQDVIINIIMYTDTGKAGKTDLLEDSVDYKMVKKAIINFVENSSFLLIEKLAEEIAKVCLGFSNAKRVNITVDKPGALRYTRSVAVEIDRTKEYYGL